MHHRQCRRSAKLLREKIRTNTTSRPAPGNRPPSEGGVQWLAQLRLDFAMPGLFHEANPRQCRLEDGDVSRRKLFFGVDKQFESGHFLQITEAVDIEPAVSDLQFIQLFQPRKRRQSWIGYAVVETEIE